MFTGCALIGPPQPSFESFAVGASWVGAPVSEFIASYEPPHHQRHLEDGRTDYHWRKDRSVVGPPRHDFGPGGKIKVRPGTVEYEYCETLVIADAQGRIQSMNLKGGCPAVILPPSRSGPSLK